MARRCSASRYFVRASFRDFVGGVKQRLKSASIGPPTVERAVSQRTFLEIHVVYIGDFEFVAPAYLGFPNLLKNRRVVEVQASHRQVRFRRFGLFFDAKNSSIRNF